MSRALSAPQRILDTAGLPAPQARRWPQHINTSWCVQNRVHVPSLHLKMLRLMARQHRTDAKARPIPFQTGGSDKKQEPECTTKLLTL